MNSNPPGGLPLPWFQEIEILNEDFKILDTINLHDSDCIDELYKKIKFKGEFKLFIIENGVFQELDKNRQLNEYASSKIILIEVWITVFVKQIKGNPFTMHTSRFNTINQFTQQFNREFGFKHKNWYFVHKGRRLVNELTLFDYRIKNEGTLYFAKLNQ